MLAFIFDLCIMLDIMKTNFHNLSLLSLSSCELLSSLESLSRSQGIGGGSQNIGAGSGG